MATIRLPILGHDHTIAHQPLTKPAQEPRFPNDLATDHDSQKDENFALPMVNAWLRTYRSLAAEK